MANVINATSTGNGGLITTGDDSGVLNIQTNETTAVTIDASQNLTFTNAANLPNTFGFKNRLINGAMVIDQRNAGASVTPSSGLTQYLLDRWMLEYSQTSKLTIQQNAGSVTPPAGFKNYLGITVAAAVTIGASDYFDLQQKIEGLNVYDFAWGTANAQSVTLSFWVRSSVTGTFGGSLRNGGGSRSYPFTYTINAANTWEQKSVTIAGDTSGTWPTDNGIGWSLIFGLGMGATYSGAAGSWASANYASATGAVSLVATNGATWYVTGVQLEKGTQATSFDFRSIGTELALCQRYHVGGANTAASVETGPYYIQFFSGISYSSGQTVRVTLPMKVQMRATPSLQTSNNGQFGKGYFNAAGASISLYDANKDFCSALAIAAATTSFDLNFAYALDAEL